jgi:hypothetical protein
MMIPLPQPPNNRCFAAAETPHLFPGQARCFFFLPEKKNNLLLKNSSLPAKQAKTKAQLSTENKENPPRYSKMGWRCLERKEE